MHGVFFRRDKRKLQEQLLALQKGCEVDVPCLVNALDNKLMSHEACKVTAAEAKFLPRAWKVKRQRDAANEKLKELLGMKCSKDFSKVEVLTHTHTHNSNIFFF